MRKENIKYEWVQDYFIDINKELDLSNRKINHNAYSITIGNQVLHESFLKQISHTNQPLKIDTRAHCVDLVGDRYYDMGSGASLGYSIAELYRRLFKDIDTLNTDDLLANIIIIYAIKRAQNGDEKAIEEFVKLYKGKAIKITEEFLNTKNVRLEIDAKQLAEDILRLLISGDRPENTLILLKYSGLDKLQFVNTRKMDKLVAIYVKVILPYVKDVFFNEVSKLAKKWGKTNSIEEKGEIKRQIDTVIESLLLYMLPHSWMMGDPHIKGKRFNPDVFRPTKKANLTVWLFGKNGRFRQRLSDWFKNTEVQDEVLKQFKTDSLDIEVEHKDGSKVSKHEGIEDERSLDWLKNLEDSDILNNIMNGIPNRDIEILYLHFDKKTYSQIAKIIYQRKLSYRQLSTKQIGRIIDTTLKLLRRKA